MEHIASGVAHLETIMKDALLREDSLSGRTHTVAKSTRGAAHALCVFVTQFTRQWHAAVNGWKITGVSMISSVPIGGKLSIMQCVRSEHASGSPVGGMLYVAVVLVIVVATRSASRSSFVHNCPSSIVPGGHEHRPPIHRPPGYNNEHCASVSQPGWPGRITEIKHNGVRLCKCVCSKRLSAVGAHVRVKIVPKSTS
jgi:hypothetical protein